MLDFTNYYDDDLEEILQLFYETVHNVNAQDNSQTQLDAWAPLAIQPVNVAAWQKTLRNNKTYVARAHHQIVGFGDMTMEAIRISLYVHKDFQGQEIEAHAKKLGLTHICTDASLLASPFFERKGY
ncbi:GNAT family N-acetyltransferase [Lysinibacillus capsici]|uniref:GNAT family N-acetyltransferase n=1 Tax=Lysinibacillus capsici TaxID=2115968 RepID=UPI0028B17EE8|nr:GNAT family N-acetyltransferase [Lysinibacillus capsici]